MNYELAPIDVTVDEYISETDANLLLDEIAELETRIEAEEHSRDELIKRYQEKIDNARVFCDKQTQSARDSLAVINERLRRFAERCTNDKKRSVPLANGTLSFRKQPPKFFFDDNTDVSGKDKRLIDFVKNNAHEFLKVTYSESADWSELKKKLSIGDNGDVIFAETGEVVAGLHGAFIPDKFSVKLA